MSGAVARGPAAVGLLVVMLLASSVVTVGAATAGGQASMDEVNVSNTYNASSPAQTATVLVTVSAPDNPLRDVKIDISRANQTLVVPNSFTTTITPSNQEVNVTPLANNRFQIERLEPGETINIRFEVALQTLEPTELSTARVSVGYTQRGQRLSATYEPTADITDNPWREQEGAEPPTGPVSNLGVMGLIGVSGTVLGALIVYGRRSRSVTWAALEPAFSRARRRVDDSVALSELDRLESSVRNELEESATEIEEGQDGGSDEESWLSKFQRSTSDEGDIDDDLPDL